MAYYKIVSLYPAGTDLLAELGLSGRVIAVSHRCDLPDSLDQIPRVTHPGVHRLVPVLPAGLNVEEQVVQQLSHSLCKGDELDLETLRVLAPDLIIGRGDSADSAVLEAKVQEIWGAAAPDVVVYNPQTLAEGEEALQNLAERLGHGDRAARLLDSQRTRMTILAEKAADAVQATGQRPTLAVVCGLNPVRLQGGWLPELVEQAGGANLFVAPGGPDKYTTWLDIAAANPDKLLLALDNVTLEDAHRIVNEMHQEGDLRTLRAFRSKQVFFTDARRLTQRLGLNLGDTLQTLSEILHPKELGTRYLGQTWSEYF